jgi:superfamily II DNA or RNA helicase
MTFAVGSLVAARGREWVVLPGSDDDVVVVRPLGGSDAETTGILCALEDVAEATFPPPDPTRLGDARSAKLLRDALRIGFRSSAGPFRSFGSLAVEPRPYQLVPLLMALRQDPVRLLIADDVGIGKTVESALIAKELLATGDARRLAVLCPPHLAEQWQRELAEKFHIDATLVLAATAARLERGLPVGRTIFDVYPQVIVSMDFIKADRRKDDFVRTCPELVIVDEAHTCAVDDDRPTRTRQQRHHLLRALAADPERHLILVTATPHSGKHGSFRSLLALLDPTLADLPDDLSGEANRRVRERLAIHLVQRRRGDIAEYLGDTTFPSRGDGDTEQTYQLSAEYRSLFDDVLAFARESVRDPASGDRRRQRVQWWSALALLRAMASSPAAAAATMRTRASSAATATVEEADEIGRRTVFDQGDDDEAETTDVVYGADPDDEGSTDEIRTRRRLLAFALRADQLHGDGDRKLVAATRLVADLVAQGHHPIVFCRFIDTARYVAEQLATRLRRTEVIAVTGAIPAAEREQRIAELAGAPKRVLVATDCLSEGVNLQDHFDAVVHYDLPWNPTRLEQREGRVDRFGQPAPVVRMVTLYGADNQIDEIVLRVLLRKHCAIRRALGVSIPVPGNDSAVMDAVAENLLLRSDIPIIDQQALPGMEEWLRPQTQLLLGDWDRAADRERASRSLFAQHGIRPDQVAPELAEVRAALGSGSDVTAFAHAALPPLGGDVRSAGADLDMDVTECPPAVRDLAGATGMVRGRIELPVPPDRTYLTRTHPLIAGLASYVLDTALDARLDGPARRCGAMRTSAVTERTTLIVLRHRFHLVTRSEEDSPLLAEDSAILACTGTRDDVRWLDPGAVEDLSAAAAEGNVSADAAHQFVEEAQAGLIQWAAHLRADAEQRAAALAESHSRVRSSATRRRRVTVDVTPQLPPDVLGVYVLLPVIRRAR